jgi:two-component system, NarL family, sensor histidine kinase BarA
MTKHRSNLPTINLNIDKEFTKNSNKLLRELLTIFAEEIPGLQEEILEAFKLKQKEKLNNLLHKLYGSCIYCGLDRLKECLNNLQETINKNNYSEATLNSFKNEVKNALEAAKKLQ